MTHDEGAVDALEPERILLPARRRRGPLQRGLPRPRSRSPERAPTDRPTDLAGIRRPVDRTVTVWLPIWMDVFAAIADPVRRDLLRTLSEGSARVVDLAAGRPISRPAVSKHLRRALGCRSRRRRRRRPGAALPGPRRRAAAARRLPRRARSGRGPPPVTPPMLDALDLEVRRAPDRDRRDGPSPTRRPAPPPSTDHATPRGDRMSTHDTTHHAPPDPSPSAAGRSATARPAVVIERTFRAPVEDVGPPSPSPSGWSGGSAPGAATRHPGRWSSG